MKIITFLKSSSLAAILLALVLTLSSKVTYSQTSPCEACSATWSSPVLVVMSTTTFTTASGCNLILSYTFRERTCPNGDREYEILQEFAEVSGGGNCPFPPSPTDCWNMHQAIRKHAMNAMGIGGYVSRGTANCYALLEVELPEEFFTCQGRTYDPNITWFMNIPCDQSGCCRKRWVLNNGEWESTVLENVDCDGSEPQTGNSSTIPWDIDCLGGTVTSITLTIKPGQTVQCTSTCIGSSNPPLNKTTDIKTNIVEKDQLKVFPNPVNDMFTVSYKAKKGENLNIKIIDITGKVVIQKNVIAISGINNIVIDTKELSNGSYICKVTNGSTYQAITIKK